MNAEDSLKLARRFIGLPLEKRQMFLAALQKEGVDFARFPIPAGIEAEDRQALSYAQQRMWFLWQLDPHSGAYNLPGAVRLTGRLNLPALEQAFAALVARHETLRTVFQRQSDDSLQQVPASTALVIDRVDFSSLSADERERAVARAAEQQSVLPFDLANGPLLRVTLLKLAEQEHVLLLTLHHIVSDGWSMNVLIDEFIRCYDAFEAGSAPPLAPLPIQYSDYALWQRRWLEAGEQARQLEYWQAQLGDEHPVLELPLDHSRPAMPSYRGTRYEFAVDSQLAEQLRGTAQKHNVTLFMLLLGAFNALLHRYTGQTDIRVGVPIANRNRAEIEGLIGFFVNTQVLRTKLDGQTRVDELLQAIKETALGAQAHQDLPFERLVEALKLERSLSHTPLFQVMYNHQPHVADMASVSTASGLELGSIDWQSRTTQFDLTLDTWEKGGKLHAALTYANDLFDAATIERMARHFNNLLTALVADPHQRIGELPLLEDSEQHVLVHDWNRTQADYPTDVCLHTLIEAQVQRTPDAPALLFGDHTLTYRQLDARANQLAHRLREQGVGPDVLVGICVERSLEMVIGLLAILKAGGAYVPLDPEYPQERLAYMIEDSGIALLLTQTSLLPGLPTTAIEVLILDQSANWLEAYSEQRLEVAVSPLNLAYVIYTSGSTGKPKGAGNSHAALVNRLCWMQEAYGLDASDAVLQKTPFSFDVSVWEFFWPLLTGARLVVAAPGAHREPARLIEIIGEYGISTLHFVPSMLQAFIHEPGVEACVGLKRIVCSGEALPLDAQQHVFGKLPQAGLFNLYGPTEAAIDVTHWTCVDEGADSVPIGRPIANLRTHVLDAELLPVPSGVAGELYLGGAGLARSYHRRPGLTAERFVPCPFHDGARLYRTGDRVRQRADGVIEYLGRLDHQVKLRGLRIELGEIETRLMQHPLVREAVVLVQGGKHLVAYLVLDSAEPGEQWQQDVKAWLLGSLPEYMVPTYLMTLAKLPVTANGKLDRKALPQPDAAPQQSFVEPKDTMQKALAAIWQDVLGLERVGLEDNFFELGGDSIISIQVVSRARQAGIRLSPRDLFQYQSVRSLALVATLDTHSAVDQGPVSGEVRLLPVQALFFEQPMAVREHWNQSLLLTPREPLNAPWLEAALTHVINHHDALRLRFSHGAEGWQQVLGPLVESADLWQRTVTSDEQLTAACDEAQRSLDLENGPLLRALLVNMADGSQRLSLIIHHLVVDGVSWRVLLEDVQHAYEQLASASRVALPAKTSAYQTWAERLAGQASRFDAQRAYWKDQQSHAVELPCDRPDGGLQNVHGQKIEWRLGADLTRQLLQQAPTAYRTQVNDLLLTALARTISRWTGQPDTLIQLEGHGREDLFDDVDLTRTVGWFTSLFPVNLTSADDLDGSIKTIKEQLRAVPDKGLGYGVLRYLAEPSVGAELAALAQPRITFNYLGQFDRQFDDNALLVPATESGGTAQDQQAPLANWLTVEGQVYGGELALSWGFSREMFDAATIQRLADDYAVELQALIEHCCALEHPIATPSDFPLARITQAQLDALPVPAAQIEDLYPLSPMQQGMLFHTLYEQEAGNYINQIRVDVQGLDPERFHAAWLATVQSQEVLRTGFVWLGDLTHPLQIVRRQVELPFSVLDWRERADQADALTQVADAESRQPFDLAQAPLLRLVLVRTGDASWHLIYTHHHILMDGWSNSQLLGEVLQRYSAGEQVPNAGRYRDYIQWLQARDGDASERFWKERLADLNEPTRLAQGEIQATDGAAYGEHSLVIDAAQTRRLHAFARQQKVTANTVLQAAWLLLLQRYTGQASVAFGATVAGRPADLPGVEQQIGLFINTLPVIASPRPEQSAASWLHVVQELNLSLREHEHTPLFEIQRWAGRGGEALFDNILVFENYPVSEVLKRGAPDGLQFGALHSHEQTSYPLTLTINLGDTLTLEYSYATANFAESTIQRLSAHLNNLLLQLMDGAELPLGELSLLGHTERQALVEDWSTARIDYPSEQRVHQLFEIQAARQPDAPALLFADTQLSYRQLNARANRLARHLAALGVGPDVLVGIAVERGLDMIIGLLAVLKAGGGYVPLDPEYPQDRLQCMIEDSGTRLLLTQSHLLNRLAHADSVRTLCLDNDAAWSDLDDSNLVNRAHGENLAYVMFTSGSTGRPKGVGISQLALTRHAYVSLQFFNLEASDRILQFSTFNFDGFVEQLYPALICGASVVLRGVDIWDTDTFYRELIARQISVVDLTTAYWNLLAKDFAAIGARDYGRLKQVHAGGEAMPPEGLAAWGQAGLGHVRLLNTYGPTEATVTVTSLDCTDYVTGARATPPTMPIGNVLPGRSIYLLDDSGAPAPVGVVGELVIGGELLARGYFNRPDLTAERFMPDPFSLSGGRLYRTGDLARYNAQGVIEYVGRIDHQVKIRGFRIELGEIEARLLEQDAVRDAIVLALPAAGGLQLVGYVLPTDLSLAQAAGPAQVALRDSLKAALAERLPDYMIPAYLVFIDKLPLSPNGKLDRKALPAPDVAMQHVYVAPLEPLQVQLAAIWEAVLHVAPIGLTDHFFERGGHSLLATQVISRVRHALKLDVPMRALFEQPTLAAFATACAALQQSETLPMVAVERDQALALSFAQERQWFLWQLEPDSAAYHVPSALRLHGPLDVKALQRSVDRLVARHEPLRTAFRQDDERTVQIIHAQGAVQIHQQTLEGNEASIPGWVQAQIRQPFDLLNGPLLRINLLRVAADDHVLVITQHHIVSDGWSMQIMVEELVALYAGECAGQPQTLKPLPLQYADFAQWQRQWMAAGERERQLAYWVAQLGGEQPVLELPLDHARPAVQSYRGARLDLALNPALSAQLHDVARAEGVTLFMLLLASFQTLLHRYSGQNDVRVGVPIANRNRAETEGLIGFFVNTQVMRAQIDGEQAFREVLAQTRQAALGAQSHQDLPFEQLVEALAPERSLSRSPLFQVLFNHQSAEAPRAGLTDLRIESLAWDSATAQFDLTLDSTETEAGLQVSLTYATDLFDAATIARMAGHWQALLAGIVAEPGQRISDLSMLAQTERQVILHDWNATAADYPLSTSVQQLIEAQVVQTPDAPALVFGNQTLNYAQLNARANQLAQKLIGLGVGPESLVGIAAERSLEMVIGLLAVLKAGGAYVPLDPEYPQDRLRYMIEDSGVQLLLTQTHLRDALPLSASVQTLLLDESLHGFAESNPNIAVDGENLAYVIYTSGSTGQPKGAGNRHSALTNRLCWMQEAYGLGAGDSVLQKTPFSFDVSVWEFFWPLMTGARLVVAAPGDHRDPATLVALINREQISTLHFVPSMLQAFLQDIDVASCTSLKRIVCSGEALPADAQQQVFAKLPNAGLYNLYGPTEAAIDVTHWTCVEEGRDSVPIGQPIANLGCYILDDNLEPVPSGVLGELYLAGEGLARGYHQRPALTAERFAVSPFGDGQRIYRTGDLARYRADGVIEYAGRIDHQVKLRGLRIELGEIEARLLEHDNVREAVVLVVDGKQLVGYVVLADASVEWRPELVAHLQRGLPDYMVPNQWLNLAQMPLSPNGKLDRKALPKPDLSVSQAGYVAPRSELEQRIAAVWADVLKLERVGLTDNFFELGGDSIISIQVVGRARQAGIQFSPKDLFQHQNVQALATVARLGVSGPTVALGPVSGSTPLLPFQQLFFATEIAERHHWNQSVLLKPAHALDPQRLEQALQHLVAHHDALRLSFTATADGWTASHGPLDTAHTLLWQRSVTDDAQLHEACQQAQRSFDLADGPLVRGLLLDLDDGSQRLLLAIHHLVVDGVSWRILLEDLQSAYQATKLPAKTSAFKHWAERLQQQAPHFAGELNLWREQLQDASADLPCDHPQGSLQNRHALTVQTRLDQDLTRQLLQQAPAAYRTQVNDLLMTALARVICRWTGHASTLIQLEGHGREALFDDIDLSRTVGWFTSVFPVRLTPAANLDASIKQIKEQLRAIPNKGLGFGVLRYLGDEATRRLLGELPTPRITFNYLGQFDSQFDDAALFVPASESAGDEQSPLAPLGNWLELNGRVYGGELSLGWTFSREMFDEATIQRLADEYAVELKALIEHCSQGGHAGITPSDVPLAALTQAQLDALPNAGADVEDIYPLSPMQQGMLFHSLYEQGSGDYINQMRVSVQGLDAERLRQAWQAALENHSILRTRFVWTTEQEQPLQIVQRRAVLPFALQDWRERADLVPALNALAEEQLREGFDLLQAPLLRLVLVRTGADSHEMIYTSHHILMDGWSNSQLLGEVLQRYAGQTPAPTLGRYGDYIGWLQRQDAQASEQFWKAQLVTLDEPTRLAQGRIDSAQAQQASGHDQLTRLMDREQTQRLSEFARQQKVTLNTLVQAAWLLLLQRYTGQATVAFGATVAGRPADLPGVEQQVGLFINTLPVIASPSAEQTIGAWLQKVQAQNLALREFEYTPLADIQRWSGQRGDGLFDSLLVFENYPVAEALAQGAPQGLTFGPVLSQEQTNFPLTVLVDLGETLSVQYAYGLKHFSRDVIEDLAAHLQQLLEQMAELGSQRLLGDVRLLDEPTRHVILHDWNATAADYPLSTSVQQLIEAQVVKTPDAPALVFGNQTLSYAQLNARANQLAHKLIGLGVGPESLVGIAAERSLEMVIGLLAVLKAGGAYVPLDPEYPQDRLRYMIEDSGVQLLLTQTHLRDGLPLSASVQTLLLDESLHGFAESNPNIAVDGENLAYVIYTSGSTGQPKGAGNRHSALTNRLCWMQEAYGLGAGDSVLQKTPFSFDVSVWEFFWPLMTGARLVVAAPGDHRDPATLVALINREQISTLHFVPSMLQAFLQDIDVASCTSLKRIVCSGEALPADAQQQVFAKLPNAGLYNLYGPTEAAIDVTHWTCVEEGRDSVPIGQPIANLGCYILDDNLEPVPSGVLGELYLAGEGLARGYHQRPALTAERFAVSPFGDGQRIYRTGDLARYRADGVIEYAGRIDHQVKLRGLRIELGEIEARLLEHDNVREAVVVAVDNAVLVAYVVPVEEAAQPQQFMTELKAHIGQSLPDYMVPTHLLLLPQMPLSPNGKLDRKALPKPDASLLQQAYVAPVSDFEVQVAGIWAEVLKLERVGLRDNFFELGGHSLLATQVVLRVREQAGFDIPVRELFTSADLGDFCVAVQALQPDLQPVHDVLAKSLEALNRLSADELEKLIS